MLSGWKRNRSRRCKRRACRVGFSVAEQETEISEASDGHDCVECMCHDMDLVAVTTSKCELSHMCSNVRRWFARMWLGDARRQCTESLSLLVPCTACFHTSSVRHVNGFLCTHSSALAKPSEEKKNSGNKKAKMLD